MKINRDVWHYRLANLTGDYRWEDNTDICVYTRKIILNLILAILGALIVVVLGIGVLMITADMIAWLVASIATMSFLPFGEGAAGFVLVTSCLFLVFGLPYGWNKFSNTASKITTSVVDIPFVQTAYDAWKNKFCIKIEFESEDEDKN